MEQFLQNFGGVQISARNSSELLLAFNISQPISTPDHCVTTHSPGIANLLGPGQFDLIYPQAKCLALSISAISTISNVQEPSCFKKLVLQRSSTKPSSSK